MKRSAAALLILPWLVAASPPLRADRAGPILLDGSCEDAGWAAAHGHAIGAGATLKIAADRNFVWLCVTPPAESYVTADLYVRDAEGRLHNLHASAQLGERIKADAGWPDWVFGNQRDWSANLTEFAGTRRDGDRVSTSFRQPKGREFQIVRSKFPSAAWTMMLEVSSLGPGNASAIFPAGATADAPQSWATIRL